MNGWNLREKEERQILENKNKGIDERVPIRSRYVKILRNDINYIDLKEIRTFPFWNQRSNRSGLIAEERNSRKKPFGNLANRTVGSVYKDIEKGGASGLELKYDSLLRGVPGVKYRQKIQGKWMDVVEEPAKEGWDIVTTIDADIQDIAERALKSKLVETEAESGTAIIMEVKSGEIKGIVNLDRLSNGDYAEGNPNAFSYMNEPGSTFKTVTTMIALDDGVITPTDSFYVGNGLFQYNKRWVRDHYWRRGQDRGYLTVAEGMELSSNVVMSKIVLKGYEDKPEKFVDGIDRIGLRKQLTWDVPLNGIEGTSSIRYPNDKNNYWSKTTLPWMSFGYETQIPPIYMLMFYNAIANGGKMIKPFIAKQFLENGKVVKEFEAEVVNPKICKESTLEEIKKMLVGVVENGTAKVVASDYFSIAGKTGTAQIAGGGGYSGYYVSFSGYFPADEPMYTIFVGLRKPKGVPSGGGMAGMVFKNIAEQTYLRKVRLLAEDCKVDSTLQKAPEIKHGNWNNNKYVLNKLNLSVADKNSDSDWVKIKFENNEIRIDNVIEDVTYKSEDVKTTSTTIPFVKNNNFDYRWLVSWLGDYADEAVWVVFVLIVILIVTAVSNSANLTDGLDGLASGSSAIVNAELFSSSVSPASISLRISNGSSNLGLSEVKTTLSLPLTASLAIIGRLVLSRLPPQPTTVITLPFPLSTSFIELRTFVKASGVCA
jgi:cell division protein FtsI (penicillin-binding protein 3)